MTFFYAQSAAACAYLYHGDDGRNRAKLLDYLVAYYTAQSISPEELDIETAFGVDERELGKRILEFAKRVIEDGKF